MNKPLLIFDGDCGFCRGWIRRWKQITHDQVDYAPSQEVGGRFPEIDPRDFATSVHLVEPSGQHTRAAEAVFRSLDYGDLHWPLWLYRRVPGVRLVTEGGYKIIAGHRTFAGYASYVFWGAPPLQSTFQITRTLFLRGLALIYGVAFASFGKQILGLIGSQGILPARDLLAQVLSLGAHRFFLVPTLAWLNPSDHFLQMLPIAGCLFSLLALMGLAPGLLFFLQWMVYLSLVTVGGDFMSFQWDALLLETGLLAIFLAPWRWLPRQASTQPASRVILWMLRWLLFRLMLQSAWVKWASGDPLWHHFAALRVHFETQPLPNLGAWYAHHLPAVLQKGMCEGMFFIEGCVPFLIFTPRRSRLIAFSFFLLLQTIIFLTGNYCFFNLLAIVISFTLVDDRTWRWMARRPINVKDDPGGLSVPEYGRVGVSVGLLFVSLIFWSWQLGLRPPQPLTRLAEMVYPFRSINDYGLFAEMTATRPEISVEGSDDGRIWKEYGFTYKPQALERRPWQVAPYQPRLDWQMWFAALSDYRHNPWFVQFCYRLLQSSPPVLKLLKTNPFPDRPPLYLRALLYEYHFTTTKEEEATGHWWKREYKGVYLPPIALK